MSGRFHPPFSARAQCRRWLAAGALLTGLALCAFAGAQPVPYDQADPPSRVARLNYFEGSVSFAPAGSAEWSYAALNRPLTTGDQVWVDRGARSELHIDSTALRLGSETSLAISTLDDQTVQLSLAQGTLDLRVRNLPPGQLVEVDTPNLAFVVQAPGSYRLNVDANGQTTAVVVRSGSAFAEGDGGVRMEVGAQQRVVFEGTALRELAGQTSPPLDAFDTWLAQRDRREDASQSARYIPREIIGYEDLDAYGIWASDPGYGNVWYPSNPGADWAPYRVGHWVWVAPWGWTWVDDKPWGFAPFHYGRWAYLHSRWGWVPGRYESAPVYAPALVGFVGGGGGGLSWSVSINAGPGVAWFPLGPSEAYRPAYRASPAYVTNVNRGANRSAANITINNYFNRAAPRALTAVPAQAFVRGQSTSPFARRAVDPRQFAGAQVAASAPPIAPVRESFSGTARRAPRGAPPAAAGRAVVATRPPAAPAALHDQLAARFGASSAGAVPGAGRPLIRNEARNDGGSRPVRVIAGSAARPAVAGGQPAPQAAPAQPTPQAARQAQEAQQLQQRQAEAQQRQAQEAQQRPGQEQRQPQEAQQRPGQEPQRPAQDAQRRQADQAQQAQQRQAQEAQQRQVQEQQRQGQDAQRRQAGEAQQAQQRQAQEAQQRQAREAQQAQQRQGQEAQQAQQRQAQEQQRQAGEAQQRQAREAQQAQQRQAQEAQQAQQRQAGEAQQRQAQEQQRQAQEQQRQVGEAQQRQAREAQQAQQRQAQEAQQAQQRQAGEAQQRQAQEQQRQAQDAQQRQAREAQQAQQRQAQEAQQAQQRQAQESQRQAQQAAQRQAAEQQRASQQAAQQAQQAQQRQAQEQQRAAQQAAQQAQRQAQEQQRAAQQAAQKAAEKQAPPPDAAAQQQREDARKAREQRDAGKG